MKHTKTALDRLNDTLVDFSEPSVPVTEYIKENGHTSFPLPERVTYKRVKRSALKVGDKVTTNVAKPAFYSNYGGNPVCAFEPGDIGTIGAVNVPAVRCIESRVGYYHCVDFEKMGQTWRVSLYSNQIVKVKGESRKGE